MGTIPSKLCTSLNRHRVERRNACHHSLQVHQSVLFVDKAPYHFAKMLMVVTASGCVPVVTFPVPIIAAHLFLNADDLRLKSPHLLPGGIYSNH